MSRNSVSTERHMFSTRQAIYFPDFLLNLQVSKPSQEQISKEGQVEKVIAQIF